MKWPLKYWCNSWPSCISGELGQRTRDTREFFSSLYYCSGWVAWLCSTSCRDTDRYHTSWIYSRLLSVRVTLLWASWKGFKVTFAFLLRACLFWSFSFTGNLHLLHLAALTLFFTSFVSFVHQPQVSVIKKDQLTKPWRYFLYLEKQWI